MKDADCWLLSHWQIVISLFILLLIAAEKNKTIRVLNNETCQLMTAAGYLQHWWAESNRWLEAESLCSEWLYSNSQVGTCLQRHLLTWTKTSCRGLKVIVQAQLKILNWLWSNKPFGPFQRFELLLGLFVHKWPIMTSVETKKPVMASLQQHLSIINVAGYLTATAVSSVSSLPSGLPCGARSVAFLH